MEDNNDDVCCTSKRKKTKTEIEIMTSSGRHVKRRNLDESDGNSSRNKHTKKIRNGRKASRKKSSSKSLRPQRAAARNALTLFSKITGTSTDREDEDSSIDDSSESESMIQDSNIESDESGRSLQNEFIKHSKGKEVSLDGSKDVSNIHELPESHNAGNRKRLVLKLPARHSNKSMTQVNTIHRKGEELEKLARSGSLEANKRGVKFTSYFDPGCSSRDMNPSIKSKGARESSHKIEDHLGLLDAYFDGTVKWGGAKARSSKRLQSGEAMSSDARSGFRECLDNPNENKNNVGSYIITEKARDTISPSLEIETNKDNKMGEATTNTRYHEDDVSQVLDGFANGEVQSIFREYKDHQESLKMG
ncbi:hypothetical protein SLA2020_195760 [Shorea laevis]